MLKDAHQSCDRYAECGAYIGFLSNPANLEIADASTSPHFGLLPDSRQQDPARAGDHHLEAEATLLENAPDEPRPENNVAIEDS